MTTIISPILQQGSLIRVFHYKHFYKIGLFSLQDVTKNNEYLKQKSKDQNDDVARLENIADSLVCVLCFVFIL